MTERNTTSDAGESTDNKPSTNRRTILKGAAVGAAGLTVGSAFTGTGAASGIPTPPLARCGNKLKDPNGNDVILRGVNIADPGRQLRKWRGQTADVTIELALDESAQPPSGSEAASRGVQGWHNNVVRIPTQPQDIYAGTDNGIDWSPRDYMPHGDDWGEALPGYLDESHLEEYFGQIVDPLIDQIEQAGAYAMIDYHRHMPIFHQVQIDWSQTDYECSEQTFPDDVGGCGERGVLWHGADQVADVEANAALSNVYTEPQEISEALHDEISMYWNHVANRYADRDHVLFDVYNEPTGPYDGDWGAPDTMPGAGDETGDGTPSEHGVWWDLWVERAQPWIDIVEQNAPGSVATIGSPRWSQYTYHADKNEFNSGSLQMCYTAHIYMQDGFDLDVQYGDPSQNVPIFFSEFGWADGGGMDEFDFLAGNTSDPDAAPRFEEFIETYDVHPLAWCFDHTWEPYWFDHQNAQGQDAGEWMQYLVDYELRPGQWWMGYAESKQGMDEPQATGSRYQCDGSNTGPTPTPTDPGGDECTPAGVASDPVAGASPQDLDGDGQYMDVNGNCRLDSDDVVTYFENMEDTSITNNVNLYDYNSNSRIDFDDLVTLFESL